MAIIEACVESFSEAITVQKNGANRIELCDNLAVGGTTPSYGTIQLCVNTLSIPVFTMIRPRGGDFVYSTEEIQIMLKDIEIAKSLGVSGIVFGILNNDYTINYPIMKKLIDVTEGMEIIFHKAYDEVPYNYREIQQLQKIGVKHILSSGGSATAIDGKEELLKTYSACKDYNISLTVSGKITKDNLEIIKKTIPAHAYHGRLIVDVS